MLRSSILACLPLLLTLFGAAAYSQTEPLLENFDGQKAPLNAADIAFIQSRVDHFDLDSCRAEPLASPPRIDFRTLTVNAQGKRLKVYVQPDVIRSGTIVLTEERSTGLIEYTHCMNTEIQQLIPVLALMATAEIPEETSSNETRQSVLAANSFLTSHEPNRLSLRNDDLDSSATYMDFTLSVKHPVLPNANAMNAFNNTVSNTLEGLIPGKNAYFLQLYMSFTGRFSQYIGERESAPVVARQFNPTLFYRFWSSDDNYLDLGFGHESNGQRINNETSFLRAQEDYLASAEPRNYARDSLSRGWDYTFMDWQRSWEGKLITQFKLKHFLSDGPLQDGSEEYNLWEDGGARNRPRSQYDGVSLGVQYLFNRSRCFLGDFPICFQRLELTQETGYSSLFENNTTTLELTSDFFGLPVRLWGKTGYNNNLVDYYQHSTSWGLGIELISR